MIYSRGRRVINKCKDENEVEHINRTDVKWEL